MARVAAGDARAFTSLVGELYAPALRVALRVVGDRAEAEDALQGALTRLWTEAARFDAGKGSVGGWFRRIVVNQCFDRKRRLKVVAPIEAAATVPSDLPDPFEAADANARARRVDAAMAQLNPRQRAAITLFHGEGASMAEIAASLDTTPKAVEGLLARARSELSRLLIDERPEARDG
ncbi:MAG: sigma-70 family RNA polymerase sigma factor [Sphingomonadaceae bacterium]|nr:sigma-70 family RNA polymerase sigma factor [Sphingomonadaceae bacterium]